MIECDEAHQFLASGEVRWPRLVDFRDFPTCPSGLVRFGNDFQCFPMFWSYNTLQTGQLR